LRRRNAYWLVACASVLLAVWSWLSPRESQHDASTTSTDARLVSSPTVRTELMGAKAPQSRSVDQPLLLSSRRAPLEANHATARLKVEAPSLARINDTVPVIVLADVPADGASTFSFAVNYDPALFAFATARQGNFMTEGNAIARLSAVPGEVAGTVLVNVEQDGGPPVAGRGVVAVVNLRALAESRTTTRIGLSHMSMATLGEFRIPLASPADALVTIVP